MRDRDKGDNMEVETFEWKPGVTPGSRISTVCYAIVAYLACVLLIQWSPNKVKKAISRSRLFRLFVSIHSLSLCIGSLGMFLTGIYAYRTEVQVAGKGLIWLVCKDATEDFKGLAYLVSYSYYLSKYVELVDTLILAIKCKKLSLLHVFHHSVMPLMCWLWIQDRYVKVQFDPNLESLESRKVEQL